jgi:hypothetical protein
VEWEITDPEHIQAKFEELKEGIFRSDPRYITWAAESYDPDATTRSLVPFIAWQPHHRAALSGGVLAQVPILLARGRAGDQQAVRALIDCDSRLLGEHDLTSIVGELSPIRDEADDTVIQNLIRAALAGNDASTKAAIDCCLQASLTFGNGTVVTDFDHLLPEGVTRTDLQELMARYERNNTEEDLPPLMARFET